MESLIRQTRVRFSDVGKEKKEESSNIRDRTIPVQKIQSSKEEKKKQQNWFRRQFSRQMSREYDPSSGGEYSVAVAAAAFAIKAQEELAIKEQKQIIDDHEKSFTKMKSKTEDITPQISEAGKISKRFSSEPSMKKLEIPDEPVSNIAFTEGKTHERAATSAPSTKKASTFAERQQSISASKKPETLLPKPDLPYTKQPTLPPTNTNRQSSTKPGMVETEADAWEKAQMAKIKERYEKLNITIRDWENKKKEKAKRKKDKAESELELRRAKALRQYRNEMKRIDQIVAGARGQAEQNRRNEEFRVKEKANKIRLTGKFPATCLCF